MNKQYNRIWMISDIHAGARSSSLEWLNIQMEYFYNFFIPNLKKYKKENDVLFVLGDLFDNRQVVNILVLNKFFKLFEDISKILDVHIIVGNHDIYEKNSNEVTPLESFKYIPNIYVYKEPIVLNINNKKCLLMPWRRDSEHEIETLDNFSNIDYLFCHSEVKGVKLNAKSVEMHGNDIETFKSYKRIYSGHIHYSQKRRNFRFVGNPYEMTRSDMNNKKAIYILNTSDDTEVAIENTYSPRHIRVFLNDILEKNINDLKKDFNNNFIDIYVDSTDVIKYNFSTLMNSLDGLSRRMEPKIYETDKTVSDIDIDQEKIENDEFNVLNIANKYVNNMTYDKEYKEKILEKIKSLYKEALNSAK